MSNRFIKIFAGIVALYPVILGIMAAVNPSAMVPKGTSPDEALRMFGYHLSSGSIVFGVVMVAALFYASPAVLGFLFLYRGLTDLVDGIVGLITGSGAVGTEIGVIIIALLALAAASTLLKSAMSDQKKLA